MVRVAAPSGTPVRPARRRLLPDPRRALRHHAARRPRRRGGQGRVTRRRRHPHLEPAAARRRLDLLPRRQPQQALGGARPQGRRRRSPRPASWPAGPTCSSRTSSRAGWPGSAWTTRASRPATRGVVYASISGFGSGPGGRDLPGYDLMVQAISGLMSLTGDPDGPPYRAGISVFDVMAGLHATIGVLAALNARHDTGPRPARRGQPAVVGAVRAGQPVQRVRRRRRRPLPDGQQPPEPVPLRAAALLRRRPDHHGRQQRPVPPPGRGARRARARRRPPLPRQRGPHGQPRRAATAARRAARHPHHHGVVRGDHRGRRAVRPDQHHRRRGRVRRVGRSRPGRARGRGRRRGARRCATPSGCPQTPADYRLPPPGLDEHGDEIRRWLAEPATRSDEERDA